MRSKVYLVLGLLLLSLLASLPTAEAVTYGDMGTRVKIGDADFVPTLTTTLPAGIVARLVSRTENTNTLYYVHIGAAGDTAIAAQQSFRLTCGSVQSVSGSTVTCHTSAMEGDWVEGGNPDLAVPGFVAVGGFIGLVRFLEADGKPGWTPGDALYVDVDGSGTLNAGDVRIHKFSACSTCPEGRVVVAGDTDLTEAADGDRVYPTTTTYAAGAFELAWFDADNSGTVTVLDAFYIKGPSATTVGAGTNTKHPDIGDVYLTQAARDAFASGGDFGAMVTGSSQEYKRTYSVITPGLAVTNTADATLANQHGFIHFTDPDGTNDDIRRGDLFLYQGPSGSQAGTLVSAEQGATPATQPGHGTAIDVLAASFSGQLRFWDLTPAGFSENDPVYAKRPGNVAATLEIGDWRITTAPCATTCPAGSIVKAGEADIGSPLTASANLVVKWFNADVENFVPLSTISTTAISDGLGAVAGVWEPGTEGVYIGSGATVAAGMTRLAHPALAAGPTTLVACPGDADCGVALTSYAKIRVTGPDSTIDAAQSEFVYDSEDAWVSPGDLRVTAHPVSGAAGTAVAAGDADATGTNIATSDVIIISMDPACAVTCTPFVRPGDVFIFGGSFGSRVTTTTTGFVPVLTQTGGVNLVRFNRGDVGSNSDDVWYVTLGGNAVVDVNDLRLTPISGGTSYPAGTIVRTGDVTFTEEAAGNAQFTFDGTAFTGRLCHIDVDGLAGLTMQDPVFAEAVTGVFGAPYGAAGTLTAYDLRLTGWPVSSTGAPGTTFKAGTIILNGNADLTSGQITCGAIPAGQAWWFAYFDQDRNGIFSAKVGTSTTDIDIAYVSLSTTPANAPPPLFAIRLSGPNGATLPTSTGSTGGGGGGAPPPTTSPGAPIASFTCTAGIGSLAISVDGGTSSDPGGGISSWAWNWGDGQTTAASNAAQASHTYTAAGLRTVTLTVTDNSGLTGTASIVVEIPTVQENCRPVPTTTPTTPPTTPTTPPTTPTTAPTTPATTPTNNTTGPPQGTPGVGAALLVLVTVGLLALVRRRW